MNDLSLYIIPANLAGWALGGAAHLFWTLKEESQAVGHKVSLAAYRASHPYKVESGITISLVAYAATVATGQMSVGLAIACGYMGDSIAKKFFNTVINR